MFKRIKKALGLDRVRIFLYGAAPLRQSTVDYFASLDIPLLNCYGLTETTGAQTLQNSEKMNMIAAGFSMAGT